VPLAAVDDRSLPVQPDGAADEEPAPVRAAIESAELFTAVVPEPTTDLAAAPRQEPPPASESAEAKPRRRRRRASPRRSDAEETAEAASAPASGETALENGGATAEPATPQDITERPRNGAQPDMPSAAVVDADRRAGPPRRGWWNRFVRKEG
jgi:hypothetical protein